MTASDDRVARQLSRLRKVDLDKVLKEPRKPIAYRVHGHAIDGCLTVVAGKGGRGKSWLGIEWALAVAQGRPTAGIPCEPGRSMIVDGEMGTTLMVDRLRDIGVVSSLDGGIAYYDSEGFNLGMEEGAEALSYAILEEEAKLVVIDSLRNLMPGRQENNSDDMADAVSRLKGVARATGAAIVLLHHTGHRKEGEAERPRGSSAITDQADTVRMLTGVGGVLCLTAEGGKTRHGVAPEDVYFRVDPGAGQVLVAAHPGERTTNTKSTTPTSDRVEADILRVLADGPQPTKTAIYKAVDRPASDVTARTALAELLKRGDVVEVDGGYVLTPDPEAPPEALAA